MALRRLLCQLINQMHILFCFIPCNVVLRAVIVLDLNPHELISFHKGEHKSEISTPHHDESEHDHQDEELVVAVLALFVAGVVPVFEVHVQHIDSVNT